MNAPARLLPDCYSVSNDRNFPKCPNFFRGWSDPTCTNRLPSATMSRQNYNVQHQGSNVTGQSYDLHDASVEGTLREEPRKSDFDKAVKTIKVNRPVFTINGGDAIFWERRELQLAVNGEKVADESRMEKVRVKVRIWPRDPSRICRTIEVDNYERLVMPEQGGGHKWLVYNVEERSFDPTPVAYPIPVNNTEQTATATRSDEEWRGPRRPQRQMIRSAYDEYAGGSSDSEESFYTGRSTSADRSKKRGRSKPQATVGSNHVKKPQPNSDKVRHGKYGSIDGVLPTTADDTN